MIALDPRAGKERLDAAGVSGEAWMTRALVILRPGQWIVPPLSGDRIRTGKNVTPNDDASTHAGTEYDAEDDLRVGTGTVGRLRQREAVGVVGDRDFAFEQRLEIGPDRLAVEANRVGAAQQAGRA